MTSFAYMMHIYILWIVILVAHKVIYLNLKTKDPPWLETYQKMQILEWGVHFLGRIKVLCCLVICQHPDEGKGFSHFGQTL